MTTSEGRLAFLLPMPENLETIAGPAIEAIGRLGRLLDTVDQARGLLILEGMLDDGANGPLDKLTGLLKELSGPLDGHSNGLDDKLSGLLKGAIRGLLNDESSGLDSGTLLGLLSQELSGLTNGALLGLMLGLEIEANGLELGN